MVSFDDITQLKTRYDKLSGSIETLDKQIAEMEKELKDINITSVEEIEQFKKDLIDEINKSANKLEKTYQLACKILNSIEEVLNGLN